MSPILLFAAAVAAAAGPSDDAAGRLVGSALVGGRAFATVQSLTDRVGARPAGSSAAARAVEWAQHPPVERNRPPGDDPLNEWLNKGRK